MGRVTSTVDGRPANLMDWEMCSCDGVILYIGGWATVGERATNVMD
jgi:hypothetical protein